MTTDHIKALRPEEHRAIMQRAEQMRAEAMRDAFRALGRVLVSIPTRTANGLRRAAHV